MGLNSQFVYHTDIKYGIQHKHPDLLYDMTTFKNKTAVSMSKKNSKLSK